jgi:hypothetical protein
LLVPERRVWCFVITVQHTGDVPLPVEQHKRDRLPGKPGDDVQGDQSIGIEHDDSRGKLAVTGKQPPLLATLGIVGKAVADDERAVVDAELNAMPGQDQGIVE